MKSYFSQMSVTIQKKTLEQHFSVALFTMLKKVALTFQSHAHKIFAN